LNPTKTKTKAKTKADNDDYELESLNIEAYDAEPVETDEEQAVELAPATT
jgi:hypothetical protein